MTKEKYYGEKNAPDYFTPSPTTPSSSTDNATVVPALSSESVIDEAVKSYPQSGHQVVVKRYAVKRG